MKKTLLTIAATIAIATSTPAKAEEELFSSDHFYKDLGLVVVLKARGYEVKDLVKEGKITWETMIPQTCMAGRYKYGLDPKMGYLIMFLDGNQDVAKSGNCSPTEK